MLLKDSYLLKPLGQKNTHKGTEIMFADISGPFSFYPPVSLRKSEYTYVLDL